MFSLKPSEKSNRQNYFTVSNTAKRVENENASGTLSEWKLLSVYACKRCKQTVSSTIGLLSDSYALVLSLSSI